MGLYESRAGIVRGNYMVHMLATKSACFGGAIGVRSVGIPFERLVAGFRFRSICFQESTQRFSGDF